MEKFCKNLREHAMRIVNYEKKEMILITDEENKSYEKQKVCYICRKELNTDDDDDDDDDDDADDDNQKNHKARDHCHYTGKFSRAAHNICNLRYKTPKQITVVLNNGSTYDYPFIINQLAKEFKGKLECFGENAENYITFSVPVKKSLVMVKQLLTNKSSLMDLDLCRPHYQVFLITYLKFTKKNVKDAREKEKSNQYAILLGLKIIN